MLTGLLLAVGTTRQTTSETTTKSTTKVAVVQPAGPCYYINGVWVCD